MENTQPIQILFSGWPRTRTLITNLFGLYIQESALDDHSAAQPPQQRGQSTDQLALDCSLRRIVGFDCSFKCTVVSGILKANNDRFCRESVANRISPRAAFTEFCSRSSAVLSVLLIRDDLFFGSH